MSDVTTKIVDYFKDYNHQRVVVSWILVIMMFIPQAIPLKLPLTISQDAKTLFNAIEALSEGSYVIFSNGMSPGLAGENGACWKAVLYQMFEKRLKVIVLSTGDITAMSFFALSEGQIPDDAIYGEDWINFGFYPLGTDEAAIAAMSKNMRLGSGDGVDWYGTSLDNFAELPIMENLATMNDVSLIFTTISGTTTFDAFVRQAAIPYGTPFYVNSGGAVITYFTAYVGGPLKALIKGLRGGAEYELLVDRPALGVAGVESFSLSCIYVVSLIVLVNILLLWSKRRRS